MKCGVDLGYSYCALGRYVAEERKVLFSNAATGHSIPSAAFQGDHGLWPYVGESAVRAALREGGHPFRIDLRGGSPGRPTPPQPSVLFAAILQRLREDAEACFGEELEEVALSVPTAWTTTGSGGSALGLKDALAAAGMTVSALVFEPCATVLSHMSSRLDEDHRGTWLVYDFGGSHFEAALVEVTSGGLRVADVQGDHRLSGLAMDQRITDEILAPGIRERFCAPDFHRGSERWAPSFARLDLLAEEVKKVFSTADMRSYTLYCPDLGRDDRGRTIELVHDVSREAAVHLVMPLILQTREICGTVLRDVGRRADGPLAGIVMTGGSSFTPEVRMALEEEFGSLAPVELTRTPYARAEGAALVAERHRLPDSLRPFALSAALEAPGFLR